MMDRTHRTAARRRRGQRGAQAVHLRVVRSPDDAPPPASPRWEREHRPPFRPLTARDRSELILATGVVDQGWLATATAETVAEALRTAVRLSVGGPEALARMDLEPLPDEPFAWEQVPDDLVGDVGEALVRVELCASEFFGVEFRTACRRLLADVVTRAPGVVRRGQARTLAAAVVWAIAKGNNLVGRGRGPTVGLLLGRFRVPGGVSQRAATVLAAVRAPRRSKQGTLLLGSARYLTADRRRALHDLAEMVECLP